MNKDQIKGAGKDLTGKVQEGFGKMVGSSSQQARGIDRQADGKAEKLFGDTKELIKQSVKKR